MLACLSKQSLLSGAVALATLAFSSHALAGAIWQDRAAQASTDTVKLNAPLHDYRALTLDHAALALALDAAPDERSDAPPARLALPLPDGTVETFEVWRTQTMAPKLAAKYPQIRTFRARSTQHPETAARLDDTPLGFSALIRAPDATVLLQPAARGDTSHYISFRRDALGAAVSGFQCLLDAASVEQQARAGAPVPQTVTGANVRSYRLAMAATAEYTAQFGGTVAGGMAAIVQAVNRINGIYLTEFAVQFQLVDGNDQLVYTNAGAEPYTNNNGSIMLGQNQTNVDSIIGNGNYDLGHVFSTGGGGIAGVGVTCNNSNKAEGVTGSPQPSTDAFWVDYVAHEMGHQMGALHSFNTTTLNCGGGNRSASQAVEPGSGSTIMAYAGICAPNDLQPHSDAFFHAVSLAPIEARLSGSGGGTTCGTVLTTGNNPPVVASVPATTIPAQTPFALTGSATDPDNDLLTYIWEEMDLGTASPPETDDGSRPLFRSFVPSISPTRFVPELPRILAHDLTVGIPSGGDISGETYATTTRDLHFRLTVRDNHSGGGATVSTDAVVHVSSAAGPFAVTAPVGGAKWIGNTAQRVTWNVAGTDVAPVNCSGVDVFYSSDGGQTFPFTLISNAPNVGTVQVIAPNLATGNARVEVRCHGNIFLDISPGDFTVIADEIFLDGFQG